MKKTKELFFEQHCSLQNVPLRYSNRSLAILPVFFAENLKFFALTPKFIKKHFLVRKNFSSLKTILSARKKNSFVKLSKKSLLKVGIWQNGSSNIRKCDKIWFPGYVIFSWENAAKSFLGNFSAFFDHSLKKTNAFSSSQHCFLQNVPLG